MPRHQILALTKDPKLHHLLTNWFAPYPCDFTCRKEIEPGGIAPGGPDLILIGRTQDSPWDDLAIARTVREKAPHKPIILMVDEGSEDLAVEALRLHIDDYLPCPPTDHQLHDAVYRGLGKSREAAGPVHGLIGSGEEMLRIKEHIACIARGNATVLITGETGTGKELVAQAIHRYSGRAKRQMVSVNCAAIPEALLESELFGHERGAFTGAVMSREGKLHRAHGSTIFFDEIGDMTAMAQAKILRAIETRSIERIGGRHVIDLDIRIVAATNRNLEKLIATRDFREDLYFRLNVARLHLPPLRERKGDLPLLVDHFIAQLNGVTGRNVTGLSEAVMEGMLGYAWPGNVRELKNVLEATFVQPLTREIRLRDLPEWFRMGLQSQESAEEARLIKALEITHWNKSKAAQKMNWSRMTLYRKLKKYHLATVDPRKIQPTRDTVG